MADGGVMVSKSEARADLHGYIITPYFIFACIVGSKGGPWKGEPYTVTWQVRLGLILTNHTNLIKNYDFLDQ